MGWALGASISSHRAWLASVMHCTLLHLGLGQVPPTALPHFGQAGNYPLSYLAWDSARSLCLPCLVWAWPGWVPPSALPCMGLGWARHHHLPCLMKAEAQVPCLLGFAWVLARLCTSVYLTFCWWVGAIVCFDSSELNQVTLSLHLTSCTESAGRVCVFSVSLHTGWGQFLCLAQVLDGLDSALLSEGWLAQVGGRTVNPPGDIQALLMANLPLSVK